MSVKETTDNSDYRKTPLWNEENPLNERLAYLLKELTLEEKIQCLTMSAPDIERLGIVSFSLGGEAAHGVESRHDQIFNKGVPVETTVFTQPIGMSATWDTELIEKAGIVTGTEARVIYDKEKNIGLSRWAPTVDMERDPRWGRTEEGYGEDPYLTGKMSSAYILGIQGRDEFYLRCGATLKHFYANNEEFERGISSSSLDSRNKYEYYLEPFRRAIMEGKAEAVMTSYNEINGIPAIVNNEVQKLLKDQWGMKGHVVCDMADMGMTVTAHNYFETDAETVAAALKAGLDAFNDPEEQVIEAIKAALLKGLITEEDINRSIRNTFSTKLRLGIYDSGNKCPYNRIPSDRLNCTEYKDICLKVAEEAMVLLKNENHLLPLNKTNGESIAVVGPLADVWLKDWYTGLPQSAVTPLEGIKKEFTTTNLSFTNGLDQIKVRIGELYLAIGDDGCCYLTEEKNAEVFEHTDWGDNKHTLRSIKNNKFLAADPGTSNLIANREEVFSWFVQEAFKLHKTNTEGESSYTLECYNHKSIILNREGKLSCSKESSYTEKPVIFNFEVLLDGIGQATELAKGADKVIAVVGCHPIISSKEGDDRANILLPPKQHELLLKLKQVNPNIIVVLIANYPYAIDWEKENLPAILTTASGSQDLGTAIAKAISGEYSPAGRLNMTWYRSDIQLPSMRDYDIIQGKRTYRYYDGEVLYPFGYGLSYSDFIYHDMKVVKTDKQLNIGLKVQNNGANDSDEVVQLYVTQLNSRTRRPIRQLVGFQRLSIPSGEMAETEFTLPYEELKYYDVVTGSMILEDADYLIQVGVSSQDIRLEAKLHVDGVKIPNRDMAKPILCDHYDSYDNIIIHKGHDDMSCMMPKVADGKESSYEKVRGYAIYEDVSFTQKPHKLIIDIKAEEKGCINVWVGEDKLAELDLDVMSDFHEIEVPIDSEKILTGQKTFIKIEVEGIIRIVKFMFIS